MTLENISDSTTKRKQLSSFTILNIPISTVKDVIRLYNENGVEVPEKRSGRPKVFTERTQNAMTQAFRASPFMPITAQHQCFVAGGVEMSLSTFRKRMLDLGFFSYSPARKPALSERHRLNRLKWCEERVNWTIDQWKSVVWSDESRYTVVGNDGGFSFIRKEDERFLEQHILETHKFGKGSIMLWG
ncbi:hypothetical protein, partial, partial [Parasitella parasitica]